MRKAFIYSVLFHIGIAALALVTVPGGRPLTVEPAQTLDVEIAGLTVTTRNKKPQRAQKPKEEKPPKPPPAPKPRPKPEPEPEPEPDPEAVEVPPEPEPEPAPPEAPEEKQVAIVTPVAKPRPKIVKKKDDFDSMLNTLDLGDDTPVDAPNEKPEEKDFFDKLDLDEIVPEDKTAPREESQIASIIGTKLTVSEVDAVKRQFENCWHVQIGARNPEELVVEIKIWVNRDRMVRKAVIVDTARMATDKFFRTMAESARRAVLHKKCNPLNLPPGKYDMWKEITMVFDPSVMVGR